MYNRCIIVEKDKYFIEVLRERTGGASSWVYEGRLLSRVMKTSTYDCVKVIKGIDIFIYE